MSTPGGIGRAFVVRPADGSHPLLVPQPPLAGAAVGHLKDEIVRANPGRFNRKLMQLALGG
jgi:hypothetical protein